MTVTAEQSYAQHLRGPQRLLDALFSNGTFFFAFVVLAIMGGIIISLLTGAALAIERFGPGFIVHDAWDPVNEDFGALATIYGTLVSSTIAMLIGIPLSFGVALFITELCPGFLKRPLSVAIELLAGIPSIIYGIWGLYSLAPFMRNYIEPALIHSLGNAWLIGPLFQGPPIGVGVFTAGVVLAVMVLPYISSIMRDVFETVPAMLKESAYGLGCTMSEVVWNVVLPYTKVGVVGGIMLGLGRAMGETMAVTFVIGNAYKIGPSLLGPGQSISSALANEVAEADSPIYQSALMGLGLVLFIITLVVLSMAKAMLIRMHRRGGN